MLFDTCGSIIIVHTGLGKSEQGISTALAVEKTSKRGGKIINLAAEQGWLYNRPSRHVLILRVNLCILNYVYSWTVFGRITQNCLQY